MKKKFLSILLAAVMVLSLIPAIAVSASAEPVVYEAANEDELITAMLAHNTSKGTGETIRLTADITLSGRWAAEVTGKDKAYVYGIFDGNNKTIYNLTASSFVWPFGNAVFQNFTVSDKTAADGETFSLSGISALFGGNAVASEVKAGETVIVRNVTNERSLSGSGNFTGGFFGALTIAGTVRFENCTNNGDYLQSSDPSVDNSYYNNNHKIGGFVGCMNSGTAEFVGCTNNGDVNASQAGGFIGIYKGNSTVTMENCTNTGDITGLSKSGKAYGVAGGFIGGFNNAAAIDGNLTITLTDCVNTGDIAVVYPSGTYRTNAIGGLIGHAGGSTDGKSCVITLTRCGVYGCTINTNGAGEYAAPLIGKCSPGNNDRVFTVTADSCYVSQVDVISDGARKLIGVGTSKAGKVNAYNCVLNEVTENGSDEWNSSRYSGCNVAASAVNGFVDTDALDVISGGAVAGYQTNDETAPSKVRFLATLPADLSAYAKVGFVVTASYNGGENVKGWVKDSTFVYESVRANDGLISADAVSEGASYIFAITIQNIAAGIGDVTFNATPYVVLNDGSIIFGRTGSFVISVGSL